MSKRPIYKIADEISAKWPKPYFGAEPYLRAMRYVSAPEDRFGDDNGRTLAIYFLANAQSFRGNDARRLKAELKSVCDIK